MFRRTTTQPNARTSAQRLGGLVMERLGSKAPPARFLDVAAGFILRKVAHRP